MDWFLCLLAIRGNFWITDHDGNTIQSDQGVVSIMNPKEEDYQLNFVPTSTNTTFIIGQFLPNSQNLYKEYKFKGLTQEPKVIEFSLKHPKADILHEAREYKPFKFWHFFWDFWNKFHK